MSITSVASPAGSNEAWSQWQDEVVLVIQHEFRELFAAVHHDDFDWSAWRPLFDVGFPALTAVEHALSSPSATGSRAPN